MEPVLPPSYHSFIVCPACKSPLEWNGHTTRCTRCGRTYERSDGIWRFVLQTAVSEDVAHQWQHGQEEYEEWSRRQPDDYQQFLGEIDSVREVYTDVYPLEGAVLDVGGHDGRLRHYLRDTSKYLVVDPFAEAVLSVKLRPNLVRAYPALAQPCPFVQGVAEALPVADRTFDVVHMRSVLDHFADAAAALREANRVLQPGGRLLIGLHVTGGKSPISHAHGVLSLWARTRKKLRDAGLKNTLAAIGRRITGRFDHDEHMWHPTYDDLIALVKNAGFQVEREHWQKPPFDHVVYLMSRKP